MMKDLLNCYVKRMLYQSDSNRTNDKSYYSEFYDGLFFLLGNVKKEILSGEEISIRKKLLLKYHIFNNKLNISTIRELNKFVDQDRSIIFDYLKFEVGDKKDELSEDYPNIAYSKNFIGFISEDLDRKKLIW